MFTFPVGLKSTKIVHDIDGNIIPIGTIVYFTTSTVPNGYLVCDGSDVSRSMYPELFAVIGTTYGAGDGSTTFTLPNLLNKFIEGSNNSVGTNVSAGLPNITGHFRNLVSTYGTYMGSASGCHYTGSNPGDAACIGNDGTFHSVSQNDGVGFDASRSSAIYGNSNTVQPESLKLLPCIKAFIPTTQTIDTELSLQQTLADLKTQLENYSEELSIKDVLPIGSVTYFAANTAPTSYLLCNGAAVSRTTYSNLYSVIGNAYGSGDGSTTFNLPNLINRFIEGDSSVGTYLNAGLPNITATWRTFDYGGRETNTNGAIKVNRIGNGPDGGSGNHDLEIIFEASRSSSIYGKSSTVQPPALKLLPCIKAYFQTYN